jgi:CheY-like chemotaxis protein
VDILLVEDHDDTRTALSSLLRQWGHTTVPAATAEEALEFLIHARFDILLCDLGLPDGNGLEVVGKAKALHPAIKAIALTARGSGKDHREGYIAGFDHYLLKPPDFGQLRALLS